MAEAGLSRVGNEWRRDGKPAHIITREQARDPKTYQIAKLAAEMSGQALQIERDETDQHRRGRGEVDTSAQRVIIDRDNNRAYASWPARLLLCDGSPMAGRFFLATPRADALCPVARRFPRVDVGAMSASTTRDAVSCYGEVTSPPNTRTDSRSHALLNQVT